MYTYIFFLNINKHKHVALQPTYRQELLGSVNIDNTVCLHTLPAALIWISFYIFISLKDKERGHILVAKCNIYTTLILFKLGVSYRVTSFVTFLILTVYYSRILFSLTCTLLTYRPRNWRTRLADKQKIAIQNYVQQKSLKVKKVTNHLLLIYLVFSLIANTNLFRF